MITYVFMVSALRINYYVFQLVICVKQEVYLKPITEVYHEHYFSCCVTRSS